MKKRCNSHEFGGKPLHGLAHHGVAKMHGRQSYHGDGEPMETEDASGASVGDTSDGFGGKKAPPFKKKGKK